MKLFGAAETDASFNEIIKLDKIIIYVQQDNDAYQWETVFLARFSNKHILIDSATQLRLKFEYKCIIKNTTGKTAL